MRVALLFSVAILFGILSVFAGGGLQSAFGCLNAILIGKYLLIAIAIKALLLEPSDGTLLAPQTTAWVMALGFFGLFLGKVTQLQFHCPQTFSMNRSFSTQLLLALSIVLFTCTYGGFFVSMIPSTRGMGIQTGGWVGITTFSERSNRCRLFPPCCTCGA